MWRKYFPAFILIVFFSQIRGELCLPSCECQHTRVRCHGDDVRSIPSVPYGTETLDLGYNSIEDISPGSLSGLSNLTTLLLNDNQLSILRNDAFQGLHSLRTLYLHRNSIKQLEPNAFRGLSNLTHLFLHNNVIKHIKANGFSDLASLQHLRLDTNPIHCDCSILWLVDWLSRNKHLKVKGTCYSPNDLSGVTIISIDKHQLHCEGPIIVKEPEDAVVSSGQAATFKCSVRGSPEPEVIWMRDDSPIINDHRYLILDNGTLVVKDTKLENDGYFECVGINPMGKAKSRPVKMKVKRQVSKHEIPIVYSKSPNLFLNVGDDINLECSITGFPKPHIHWYHNNNRMMLTDRAIILSNGKLIMKNITSNDSGLYSCHGVNLYGRVSANITVNVAHAPSFLTIPENKTASVGDQIVLLCQVNGDPAPIITWSKHSNILYASSRVIFNEDSSVMTITDVDESDDDVYTCTAENKLGYVETTFIINVESEKGYKPEINQKPFDVEAEIGSSIEMPCKSKGIPDPRIEWRKDGTTVNANGRIKISSIGSLMIYNLSLTDGGRYECSVINEYGRDTASAILIILGSRPGDQYVSGAVKQAIKEIDEAISKTIDALINKTNHIDPFRVVRYPDAPARAVARSAEIYERALHLIRKKVGDGMKVKSPTTFHFKDILSPEQIDTIAELSGCTAHRKVKDCNDFCFHNKYRSIDGTCNNYKYNTWGASLTGFRRILKPIYENGFSLPVGWHKDLKYNGHVLPSARQISTELISTKKITEDNQITHMVMQWGQFLDHDLDHALPSVSSQSWDGIDCKKSCDFAPPCFPMEVPPNDTRIPNRRCIDFIRTSAVCGSGMTSIFFSELQTREQVNQLTSYIDGSQIYGFSNELANDLRDFTKDDGNLRVGPAFEGKKPLLPFAGNQGIDCRRDPIESNINCFVAGDIRVNEQIGLTAMHTIWMRQHNRLTKVLKHFNPFWDGEKLYQEARKIVGAQIQFITYEKWLPIILGPKGMADLGTYKKYDPNLNPSISNVFATAALRFGHTLINPILHRYDENFDPIPQGHLDLHKAFFAPWRLVEEGGVDPLIRGMFMTPAKLKKPQENLNDELTEKLFHTAHAVALDLAAMNVQRARDHAIPTYVEWRKFCNMTEIKTFDDLKHEISDLAVRRKLEKLYKTPENIDVFVGGILEDQVDGGKIGPLFRCLLVEQFKRLRDGDRLWYEHPKVFKPEQLEQIKETRLSRIICDNGDKIDTISEDLFLLPELQDGLLDCDDVPSMDLRYWADCQNCQDNEFDTSRRRRSVSFRDEIVHSQLADIKESYIILERELKNIQNLINNIEIKNAMKRVNNL